MKKTLAWIATLALLLTSLSGLATVSFSAAAEGTDHVLYDFSDAAQVSNVDMAWGCGATVSHEDGRAKWATTDTTYAHWRITGKAGDFNGTGISFDYEVPGEASLLFYQVQIYYVQDGENKEFNWSWTAPAQFYLRGSGTHTITYPEEVLAVADSITGIFAQTNEAHGQVVYFDNVTIHNYIAPPEPLPDHVLYDFSDAAQVNNVGIAWGHAGNVAGVSYEDGRAKWTSANTQYAHWQITGKVGDFNGTGISFDYEVPGEESILFYQVKIFYVQDGESKDFNWEWASPAQFRLSGSGTHTIMYPAEVLAVADSITGIFAQTNEANGKVIYFDNVTVHEYVKAPEPVVRDRVLYDFSTEDQAAKIQPSQGTVTYADGAATFMPTQNAYGGLYITGDPGDLNGTGISFNYTANQSIQFYRLQYVYLNEAGEEQAITYEWSNGAHVDCGTSGTRTITYTDEVKAVADRLVKVLVYGHNMTANSTTYTIDNVTVLNARPRIGFYTTAVAVPPTVSINWNAKDEVESLAVYSADAAIDKAAFESGDVSGLTLLSEETAGQESADFVGNKTYYYAMKAVVGGETFYRYAQVTAPNVLILQDFETITDPAGYAYDRARKFPVSITEHNGSKMATFTGSASLVNQYPHITVGGPKGSLAGDELWFYIDSTNLDGEHRNEWYDQLYLYYYDAAGESQGIKLSEYSTLTTGGYVKISLTDLTEEQLAGLYAVDWYAASGDKMVYIDNICIVNPVDMLAPTVSITATEDGKQNVTVTTTVGDDAVSSQAYWSENEITAANIGEAAELNDTALSDLLGGKTYYFAVKATDAAGNTGYAFTSVTTTTKVQVLYDFDEQVAPEEAVTVINGRKELNTDAQYAVSGNSLKVSLNEVQYPGMFINFPAGTLNATGISFSTKAAVTANEGAESAPSVSLNVIRVRYLNESDEAVKHEINVYATIPTDTVKNWSFSFGDVPVDRIQSVELALGNNNFANGTSTVYLDNIALLNPQFTVSAVEDKLEGGTIFDLTDTEMAIAREEGLLTEYAPTMDGTAVYAKDGVFRGELSFIVSNPAALTASMAANGYRFKAMGVLMLPTAMLNGALTKDTPEVLDLNAEPVEGTEGEYAQYSAVLSNSSDYTFNNISARAYAVYVNAEGKELVVYSSNNSGVTDIKNGIASRSLNTVMRLTAQYYYDQGFRDGFELEEGMTFLNSKSFETAKAYTKKAYLASLNG